MGRNIRSSKASGLGFSQLVLQRLPVPTEVPHPGRKEGWTPRDGSQGLDPKGWIPRVQNTLVCGCPLWEVREIPGEQQSHCTWTGMFLGHPKWPETLIYGMNISQLWFVHPSHEHRGARQCRFVVLHLLMLTGYKWDKTEFTERFLETYLKI